MALDDKEFDFGDLEIKIPKNLPKIILALAVLFVVLAGVRQTFFTVAPEDVGIILRFGKVERKVPPGLHFKLPFGIEEVYHVPIQRQLKQEFGYRTTKAGIKSEYQKRGYEDESLMITGDLNAVDVEWIIQYRINDPEKYLFHVRSVEDTFRDMTEAIMREVVGDHSVDEVITVGKEKINIEVKEKLQELCKQYETGISIQFVALQDVNPPPPVQASWNEVNEAEQEKDKLINEAKTRYNALVPKAKGEASRMIKEAEGYELERVNMAEGDRKNFIGIYAEYRKAPVVTRRRMYLETMAKIMPRVGRKIIVDEDEKSILRFLDLTGSGKGR